MNQSAPKPSKYYSKSVGGKVLEIIEQFEIPQEYHHAIWEAFSAGAEYGFFKALGKVE